MRRYRKKLLTLAGMIGLDESALICDLAETYGVLYYRALPVKLLATLCAGLRDSSRIKMKSMEINATPLELMVAHAADNLSLLRWGLTEDGQKGRNRPALFTELIGQERVEKPGCGYASGAEFEAARAALLKEVSG